MKGDVVQTVGRWELPAADTYFKDRLTERGFEIEKLDAALKHVTNWRTAVDGGAHIGTWSVAMAARFKTVLAFEPAHDTFQCLTRNLGGIENVVPLQAALGSEVGRAALRDCESRPGNTGARYLVDGDSIDVECLDAYGIDDLDFLKLDLEGHEYCALLGARATLLRCRPVVCIESKRGFGARYGIAEDAALSHDIADGAALRLLEKWGAREVERMKSDHVFVF